MSSINNIKLSFIESKFDDFRDKLKDLSSIDDIIKLKISKERIFMYSLVTNGHAVLSLKSYVLETSDYINNLDDDYIYDFIIGSSKKFVKSLSFFNSSAKINLTIHAKKSIGKDYVMEVRSGLFTNSRLKISQIGLEPYKIRDIEYEQMENMLNVDNCQWKFTMSISDFNDVKKLSSINSDNNIIDINVLNGKVMVSESSNWELEIDKTDENINNKITFVKKYLSNIDTDVEFVDFLIFNTFILIKNKNSNLMMSFETNFE